MHVFSLPLSPSAPAFRRRLPAVLVLLAVGALWPSGTAAAQRVLRTANDFVYDMADAGGEEGADRGQLLIGTETVSGATSSYDGAYLLEVGEPGETLATYRTGNTPAMDLRSGRLWRLADWTVPGLGIVVHREFYVPPPSDGGEYARYLDVLENPTGSPVEVEVRIGGGLGTFNAETPLTGDAPAYLPGSPQRQIRDQLAEPQDLWVIQDDRDAGGIPSLLHLIRGAASEQDDDLVRPVAVATDASSFSWTYRFTIPAGGRRALLTFALQAATRDAAVAEAERILALPDDVLVEIPRDIWPDVANWQVGDLPRVFFDAPRAIDEGLPITVGITVDDPEGDPATWSVDVPTAPGAPAGDGDFSDGTDVTEVTIPGELTDGDMELRVFVRAHPMGEPDRARVRGLIVNVRNVPPRITSRPSTPLLAVGNTWAYDIEFEDVPAESSLATPPGFVVGLDGDFTRRPDGMTGPLPAMREDGSLVGELRWDVQRDQRGQSFPLTVKVTDAAGGEAVQEFDLIVSGNRPPESPVILGPLPLTDTDPGPVRINERQPLLRIENAPDPERDEVRYHYRVATESGFADENVIARTQGADDVPLPFDEALVEGDAGETSWQVPIRLEPGAYFWEVRAIDEQGAVSDPRFATFYVQGLQAPDAGPPPPPDRGSDGCRIGGTAAPSLLLLALAPLAVLRRRRRRSS